jgi:hypothetical protein
VLLPLLSSGGASIALHARRVAPGMLLLRRRQLLLLLNGCWLGRRHCC